MALLRNETQNNFTIIGNYILQNKDVSLKAIGMYAKIASLPDRWKFTEAGLVAICRDGKDAVKSALKELEDLNLLYRFRAREENGTLGEAIYFISSHPMTEEEKKEIKGRYYPIDAIEIQQIVDNSELEPMSDFPTLDNPMLDNPQQLNTNILNTNILNTKNIKKERKKEKKPTFDELIDAYTQNEFLREELKNHLATRKAKKAALTNRAIELSLKTLDSLVENKPINDQENEKIKIVQRSIENGWTGFFPIKEKTQQWEQKQKNNNKAGIDDLYAMLEGE